MYNETNTRGSGQPPPPPDVWFRTCCIDVLVAAQRDHRLPEFAQRLRLQRRLRDQPLAEALLRRHVLKIAQTCHCGGMQVQDDARDFPPGSRQRHVSRVRRRVVNQRREPHAQVAAGVRVLRHARACSNACMCHSMRVRVHEGQALQEEVRGEGEMHMSLAPSLARRGAVHRRPSLQLSASSP